MALDFPSLNVTASPNLIITGTGPSGTGKDALIDSEGRIVVAGTFSSYSGATARRIIRLFANGVQDTTFSTGASFGFNGDANSLLAMPDGEYVVGGLFTTVSGATCNGIARLYPNGVSNTAFTTNTSAGFSGPLSRAVNTLLEVNGEILAGGFFNTFNGNSTPGVARLYGNGVQNTSFTANAFGGTVTKIIKVPGNEFIIVGGFGEYNSNSSVERIVRIYDNGVQNTSFVPLIGIGTGFANGQVNNIYELSDGEFIATGQFTGFNNVASNRIAKLTANGQPNTTFATNIGTGFNNFTDGILELPDGEILIGGQFTTFNGNTAERIVRLYPNGVQNTSYTSGTQFDNSTDYILDTGGYEPIVFGSADNLGSTTINGVARLSSVEPGARYKEYTYDGFTKRWLKTAFRSVNVSQSNVTFTFDANVDGWANVSNTSIISSNTSVERTGNGSILLQVGANSPSDNYRKARAIITGVYPNTTYIFSGYARSTSGEVNVAARIFEYSGADGTTEVGNTTGTNVATTNSSWTPFFATRTLGANAQSIGITVMFGNDGTGSNVHVDDIQLKYESYGTSYTTQADFEDTVYFPEATGGVRADGDSANVTVTTAEYKYHVFQSNGLFTVSKAGIFEALMVGGGGGGGNHGANSGQAGGGGGAGGVVHVERLYLPAGDYNVVVGAGGAGAANTATGRASRGGESYIIPSLVAVGGGPGGSIGDDEQQISIGASGGGGYSNGGRPGRTGITGQGNNGGNSDVDDGGGGGGGAGGVGSNAPGGGVNTGGAGGPGTTEFSPWGIITNTGVNVSGVRYFAAGGGGGGDTTGGAGGTGGGGAGSSVTTAGGNATAYSGGGGGGAENAAGGNGASGIILIRYLV